ncbi:hypothetical protein EJ05DRAFT_151075 [Pseudovirgaria hyperparasitica]|uniref:Uncharacterized protein n=1 Tax=Pseudovirgaria hyperparasitica TaxID=470096 RepID=A0A6A6VWF5_9PEZI|nr:uncharacterized protein EJ05DRAFT_151075 [Pseudovirgaria hyperparasitica]KAF2754179.1 hypothetical protein EJ05DRAFT_151075 [Pseudovirgaria hyperparasitica]
MRIDEQRRGGQDREWSESWTGEQHELFPGGYFISGVVPGRAKPPSCSVGQAFHWPFACHAASATYTRCTNSAPHKHISCFFLIAFFDVTVFFATLCCRDSTSRGP